MAQQVNDISARIGSLPRQYRERKQSMANLSLTNQQPLNSAVQIFTYNVLSPDLATRKAFGQADPAHLDNRQRFQRILAKLEEPVANGAIIALQEVSAQWAGPLTCWFQNHSYTAIPAVYRRSQGYTLGVLLAVPDIEYNLENVQILSVADWAKQNLDPPATDLSLPTKALNVWRRVVTSLANKRTILADYPEVTPWTKACSYSNLMILAQLRRTSGQARPFMVATYHAPCLYYNPPAQELAISQMLMAAQAHNREFVGADQPLGPVLPLFLAGDFNIRPGTPVYRMFQAFNFVSLYHQAAGAEPTATVISNSFNNPFCDTLDYVLFLDGERQTCKDVCARKVVAVLPSVKQEAQNNPASLPPQLCMPNASEPSDHLPLLVWATLCDRHNGLSG